MYARTIEALIRYIARCSKAIMHAHRWTMHSWSAANLDPSARPAMLPLGFRIDRVASYILGKNGRYRTFVNRKPNRH
jgi:hypothetical protein